MNDIMQMPVGVYIKDRRTGIVYKLGEWLNDSQRVFRDNYGMWGTIGYHNEHLFEVID